MRLLLQRIPPESRVAGVVLAAALVQVGLLAWFGLRATERRREELEDTLRGRTASVVQRAVVGAGLARVDAVERAAQLEIERAGRPLAERVALAVSGSGTYDRGYLVAPGADGVATLYDPRLPPLAPAARTARDDAARERVAELERGIAADPARVARSCESVADATGDAVASALALQAGWRAAFACSDHARALQLTERVLREAATVRDDRGVRGESVPFGIGAAAAICEVRRRAVLSSSLDQAEAFARAVTERRLLAQRLRDVLGPAAYEVEREECHALVTGTRLHVPAQTTRDLEAFLRRADADDAALDTARRAEPGRLAAALARGEAVRLAADDGVLAVLPLPADERGPEGARAVALHAPRPALVRAVLAPLREGIDVPAGVAIVVHDADGAVLEDTVPGAAAATGEPLVRDVPFGAALPGATVSALLADPTVLDAETQSARRLWLWTLAASVLAVVAAGLLAARAVMREVRLARLKSDFVSNLSHELRTPLTSLRMFVETLQEGRVRDEDEARQCLAFIGQETDRLAGLVDRILQFASFSRGRAPIELRSADAAETALRAVEVFGPRAARAGASVETSVEPGLPESLLDRDALIQVLLNLLDNAVKYGRENGARVRVSVRAAGARVRFEVEDDGPGVPERERELVFEEFYRGDDSLASRVQGAGIGLALCRRIVLAHGGRIEADTSPELGGARFTVTLPDAATARRIAVAHREERG